jgi:hypothetical protein
MGRSDEEDVVVVVVVVVTTGGCWDGDVVVSVESLVLLLRIRSSRSRRQQDVELYGNGNAWSRTIGRCHSRRRTAKILGEALDRCTLDSILVQANSNNDGLLLAAAVAELEKDDGDCARGVVDIVHRHVG